MKKTISVTMEVEVHDLSSAELRAEAKLCECEVDELPVVADLTAEDIADTVVGSLDTNEETFAGSNMYIRVSGVRVVSAAYKD